MRFSNNMRLFVLVAGLAGAGFVSAVTAQDASRLREGTSEPPLINMNKDGIASRVKCMTNHMRGSSVIDERTLAIYDEEGDIGVLRLSGPCLKGMSRGSPWITIGLDTHADQLCSKRDFAMVNSRENSDLNCAVTRFEVVHLDDHPRRD